MPIGGSPPGDWWTESSEDPVPLHLSDSEVGWLTTDPWMWSLIPLWPRLHTASVVLVRALAELDEHTGAAADRTRHGDVAARFLASISGDIRRLTCRVVAGITIDSEDVPGQNGSSASAEVTVAADLAERYRSRLAAADFAAAHAPLLNQIEHVLSLHCSGFGSMTQRLAADWSQLTELTGSASAVLRGVSAVGDLHERGAVLALDLSTGNRMFYKPHSLLLDIRLGELCGWLENREPGLAPRTPNSIDRHDYGWQDCVVTRECAHQSEVATFYRRVGALLAVAYALRATDLHHENVLCAGTFPVIVDPECFFSTSFRTTADGRNEHNGPRGATVLDIGVLPDRLRTGDVAEPLVDISILGHTGRRRTPRMWRELMRDTSGRLHLQLRPAPLAPARHVPFLHGKEVPVHGHEGALLDGFATAYRSIMSGRDELLGEDGLLAGFAEARVRHILRATSTYVSVIWELGNPVAARCGLRQEEVVNALWPQDAHDRPEIARLFEHERAGLLRGCVPTFERPAAGRALEYGARIVQELCEVSGLDLARQRISRLSEHDLHLQTSLVKTTLVLPQLDADRAAKSYAPTESTPLDRAELLALAKGIGTTLTNAMILSNGPAWWLVGSELQDGAYAVQPSSFGLYNGSAGIALFAGYLDIATGRRSALGAAAEHAMTTGAEQMLERGTIGQLARARQLGVFDGLWGCVYTATCLGLSRGDAGSVRWAAEVGDRLASGSAELPEWDVISGTAGIGAVASELALLSDLPQFVNAARTALDATCVHMGRVLSSERIQTGIAHGMAGVALAFERGAPLFPADDLGGASAIAWEAEHSCLYGDDRGWHDVLAERGGVAQDAKREGWCRGASGIGLGLAVSSTRGAADSERVRLAVRLALRRAIGTDQSLCHGAMGALEFLSTPGVDALGAPAHNRLLGGIAASAGRWLTGLPDQLPDPGLMTGLAGVGYGILRLLEPDLVPRVLTLHGPRSGARMVAVPTQQRVPLRP